MEHPDDLKTACDNAIVNSQGLEDSILQVAATIARPGDWKLKPGCYAKLSSIGAERFLKYFPIEFCDLTAQRLAFSDETGSAFRWVYRMRASLYGLTICCEGRISSRDWIQRDEKGEEVKGPITDEGGMMGAALLLCEANGVKILLGLRYINSDDLITMVTAMELGRNFKGEGETE